MRWHRGHMFHVTGSPDLLSAPAALVHEPDGGLLVSDDTGNRIWKVTAAR